MKTYFGLSLVGLTRLYLAFASGKITNKDQVNVHSQMQCDIPILDRVQGF